MFGGIRISFLVDSRISRLREAPDGRHAGPMSGAFRVKCSLGGKGEKKRHRSQDADHVGEARTAIRFTVFWLRASALVVAHLDRK